MLAIADRPRGGGRLSRSRPTQSSCSTIFVSAFPADSRLSGMTRLHAPYLAIVPAIGGAILGLTGIFIKRWRPRRPVDPIEANALHGGRMSLIDSSLIALQTVVSCGFGASVGLEAGYTQIGSGFGSTVRHTVPNAAQRHAHARGLRRGRRHRGGVSGAADGRLLRF